MIKIEDMELKGEGYITVDNKGTWVWEVKPKLIEGEWRLPSCAVENKSLLLTQTNGAVLPTLLGMSKREYNDTFKVFQKPRIYKIVLEEC